jgi:hypothetical protein
MRYATPTIKHVVFETGLLPEGSNFSALEVRNTIEMPKSTLSIRDEEEAMKRDAAARFLRKVHCIPAAEIDAARTKAGGWTKEQLAKWGVPWPPPKGWRKALIAGRPIA